MSAVYDDRPDDSSVVAKRAHHGPALRGLFWVAGVWLAGTVLGMLVLAPASAPAQFLTTIVPFAQLIAFPVLLGCGVLAMTAMAWFVTFRWIRRWRMLSLPPLIVCAISAALLIALPHHTPWKPGPDAAVSASGRTVSVATFNSQDTLTHADLDALVSLADPDVIVLPEASEETVRAAVAESELAGAAVFLTEPEGFSGYVQGAAPTALIVHPRLGTATTTPAPATSFGTVGVTLTDLPPLIGVHTAPPVPALMQAWRDDLARISAFADDPGNGTFILAGDLNATLRHGALAHRQWMVDTAEQCPGGPVGTWPAGAASWTQTPIDHVFISPDIQVISCTTAQLGAADHLSYVTTLRVPTP